MNVNKQKNKLLSSPQRKHEWLMQGHVCARQDPNRLILVGTFSEDMMTTGISFSLDDSCMRKAIFQTLRM